MSVLRKVLRPRLLQDCASKVIHTDADLKVFEYCKHTEKRRKPNLVIVCEYIKKSLQNKTTLRPVSLTLSTILQTMFLKVASLSSAAEKACCRYIRMTTRCCREEEKKEVKAQDGFCSFFAITAVFSLVLFILDGVHFSPEAPPKCEFRVFIAIIVGNCPGRQIRNPF